MFTWICPQCGKEVPPHENECPYCHGTGKIEERAAQAPAPAPPAAQPPAPAPPPPPQQPAAPIPPPPPPQQAYAPPPQAPPPEYAAPAPPQYAEPVPPRPPSPPPQYAAPAPPQQPPPPGADQQPYYEIGEHRRSMPGWLVTLLVAAVVMGVGALLYYFVLPSNGNQSAAQQGSPFEEVPEGGQPSAAAVRLSRHIEVTGFRLTEDADQRAQCQFLVVNHSAADIGDLAGIVSLRTTEAGPDDDPIAEFEFKTTRLGPYESIEFKTIIDTSLRAYELPDWQFLQATVEITSPQEP